MRRLLVRQIIVIGVLVSTAAIGRVAQAAPVYQGEDTPTPTPTQGESTVHITRPRPNESVSGVVSISGTAVDGDFLQYELSYAPDPTPSDGEWTDIQPAVQQEVRNDVLGAWDTTALEDGRYILRLRLVRNSGEVIDDQIRVAVRNATATPTPVTPTVTPTHAIGTATPGPSPTPLIQQPPTRTPAPTITPGGPTATPERVFGATSPLRPERLRQAAWSGVLIALGVFGVLALYGLFRAALRGEIRESWWNFRREAINPLLDSLRGRKPKEK